MAPTDRRKQAARSGGPEDARRNADRHHRNGAGAKTRIGSRLQWGPGERGTMAADGRDGGRPVSIPSCWNCWPAHDQGPLAWDPARRSYFEVAGLPIRCATAFRSCCHRKRGRCPWKMSLSPRLGGGVEPASVSLRMPQAFAIGKASLAFVSHGPAFRRRGNQACRDEREDGPRRVPPLPALIGRMPRIEARFEALHSVANVAAGSSRPRFAPAPPEDDGRRGGAPKRHATSTEITAKGHHLFRLIRQRRWPAHFSAGWLARSEFLPLTACSGEPAPPVLP